MTAYYNEHDRYAADWLRNLISEGLIAPGEVDDRDIQEVRASDLRGFAQCHFFAGIGGWSRAARIAGIPDDYPLWTGSCPCQPFSAAGKQRGTDDERHLWPEFRRLLEECRPPVVLGEQVASRLGREWLAGVRLDLEDLGYAVGAADLCAASAGAPHIRQRLWWAAHADGGLPRDGHLQPGRQHGQQPEDGGVGRMAHHHHQGRGVFAERDCEPQPGGQVQQRLDADGCGGFGRLGDAGSARGGRDAGAVPGAQGEGDLQGREDGPSRERAVVAGADGRLGHSGDEGLEGRDARALGRERQAVERAGPVSGFWSDCELIPCSDGKARRVESSLQLMADGLPQSLGPVRASQLAEIEAEIEAHAKTCKTTPGKAVHDLWRALIAQTIQRPAGGPDGVREALVLLAFLRQLSQQGRLVAQGLSQPCAEAASVGLRSLRHDTTAAGASRQRGLDEQQPCEPPDSVRVLSSILARHAQAAWGEAIRANAAYVHPLAKGVPGRVGKLRAAGNAIVPQVAAIFIRSAL